MPNLMIFYLKNITAYVCELIYKVQQFFDLQTVNMVSSVIRFILLLTCFSQILSPSIQVDTKDEQNREVKVYCCIIKKLFSTLETFARTIRRFADEWLEMQLQETNAEQQRLNEQKKREQVSQIQKLYF